jgi:hypothetical protein
MFQNSQRIRYDRTPEDERKMMERLADLRMLPVCNPCWQPVPGNLASQGVSEVKDVSRTEVESRLLRLGKPLRKAGDPKEADMPCVDQCESANGDACPSKEIKECDGSWNLRHFHECPIVPEETRTTHPPCRYREMTIDRFDPLCRNPQNPSAIFHPGEIDIHYRLVVKDNHRPCLPTPVDPTLALPKEVSMDLPAICPEAPEIKQTFVGDLRPWRHTQDLDVAFGRKEPPTLYYQSQCNRAAMRGQEIGAECTPFFKDPAGSLAGMAPAAANW